jgi:hypothetical protein
MLAHWRMRRKTFPDEEGTESTEAEDLTVWSESVSQNISR